MVHSDHLGRPIRMTDATKATVFQAQYKPYGEVQSTSGTKALNLLFPGQYFQIETGLTYNWHRHYDPVTGRYTQVDPLRFVDGPSVYNYVNGSPFMKTDRSGQMSAAEVVGALRLKLPNSSPPNAGAQQCDSPTRNTQIQTAAFQGNNFGFPSAFWNWYHREVKQPGQPDLDSAGA